MFTIVTQVSFDSRTGIVTALTHFLGAQGFLLRERSVEAQMEQDRNSGTDQGLKEMLVLGGKTYKHFAKFF